MQTTTNGHDPECRHREPIEVAVIGDPLDLGETEPTVRVVTDPAAGQVRIIGDDRPGDDELAEVISVSNDNALALAAALIESVRQSSAVWDEHYAEHEAGQE